jgi:hypothetical protein
MHAPDPRVGMHAMHRQVMHMHGACAWMYVRVASGMCMWGWLHGCLHGGMLHVRMMHAYAWCACMDVCARGQRDVHAHGNVRADVHAGMVAWVYAWMQAACMYVRVRAWMHVNDGR